MSELPQRSPAERWAMVLDVTGLVQGWVVRRVYLRPDERGDAIADVQLKLFERAKDYDPRLGSWKTFATWVIRGAVRDYLCAKRMFGPMSQHGKPAERVGMPFDAHADAPGDRELAEALDRRELAGRVIRRVRRLPARERAIVERHLEDLSLTEVGEQLGVTRQRVQQIEAKVLAGLRDRLACADRDQLRRHRARVRASHCAA